MILGRFHHSWKVIDVGTGGAGFWLPKRVVDDLKILGWTADVLRNAADPVRVRLGSS